MPQLRLTDVVHYGELPVLVLAGITFVIVFFVRKDTKLLLPLLAVVCECCKSLLLFLGASRLVASTNIGLLSTIATYLALFAWLFILLFGITLFVESARDMRKRKRPLQGEVVEPVLSKN